MGDREKKRERRCTNNGKRLISVRNKDILTRGKHEERSLKMEKKKKKDRQSQERE